MDGLSSAEVISALTPLALYVGQKCLGRIRDARKIQKHCLVIPHRCGKTRLAEALENQSQILVIDVDEYMPSVVEQKELGRLLNSKVGSFHWDLDYSELADEVLADIKKRLKHHKKLRVLFLTSSFKWAVQSFRKDAVYCVSPDSKYFEELLENEEDEGKKLEITKARQNMINSVPDKKAIKTYSDFKQLEEMVRQRLNIQHTL